MLKPRTLRGPICVQVLRPRQPAGRHWQGLAAAECGHAQLPPQVGWRHLNRAGGVRLCACACACMCARV